MFKKITFYKFKNYFQGKILVNYIKHILYIYIYTINKNLTNSYLVNPI